MSELLLYPCDVCGFKLSVAIVRPTTRAGKPTERYRKCPLCGNCWYQGRQTSGQEQADTDGEDGESMVLSLPDRNSA